MYEAGLAYEGGVRYLVEYSLAELDHSFAESILNILPEYEVLEPDMQRWFEGWTTKEAPRSFSRRIHGKT